MKPPLLLRVWPWNNCTRMCQDIVICICFQITMFFNYMPEVLLRASWNTKHITYRITSSETNKYCGYGATLMCSVTHEQFNLQRLKWKIQIIIYRNVSFLILCVHSPQLPGYPSLHCEYAYYILCLFSHPLLVSCYRSPDNKSID